MRLPLDGAEVEYEPSWFEPGRADRLLAALEQEIAWETHHLHLFGNEIAAPRLSCWIGDPGATYRYSRTRFVPREWTATLAELRADLSTRCGFPFNSVLANLYRDGDDSMGWHSDDEPELGSEPVIASLSFGAARRFRFRSRAGKKVAFALDLEHGSLLVMRGATQRTYQHDLPKTTASIGTRINLTFRRIQPVPTLR